MSPASVAISMTARSANGSWTPTELSSGGSTNATGVIVTLVMRMLPVVVTLFPSLPSAGGRYLRERREAGGEDARELLPVRWQHLGERRPDTARGKAGEFDTGLDERDGVSGAAVPQPDERMIEVPLKR